MTSLRELCGRVRLRRLRSMRAWPDWLASVQTVCRDLSDLNLVTERDFLEVGEKLQHLLVVSGEIAEECKLLVGALSREQTAQGARDLRQILEKARLMAEHARAKREALEQMMDGVRRVIGPLSDLTNKMRSFRVMATLIRIEGSRLNREGIDFQSLADDVRKLASDIEKNGQIVLAQSLELSAIVQRTAAGITSFETRQRAELPRIRRHAENSLSALAERDAQVSVATRNMAEKYDSVRTEISSLVTSLQLHDITRQQMEHAAAALEQAGGITRGESNLLVKICRLQSAQLDHAREVFLTAVRNIRDSLSRISATVAQMSEDAAAVLAGGDSGTFLSDMELAFSGMRSAFAECAESRRSLGIVAEAVAGEVREMSGFVAAIEEIGIRMQRIALNANIKAIRIGDQGCALGAVADAIQRLAAESTGETNGVALGIRLVADSSRQIQADPQGSGEQDISVELEQVINGFRTADRENGRRLSEISGRGLTFSQDLGALRAGIRADKVLGGVIEKAENCLNEVAVAAGVFVVEKPGAEIDEMMCDLQAQYTMHAERTVHQQAAGAALAESTAPGDLADNVELF